MVCEGLTRFEFDTFDPWLVLSHDPTQPDPTQLENMYFMEMFDGKII